MTEQALPDEFLPRTNIEAEDISRAVEPDPHETANDRLRQQFEAALPAAIQDIAAAPAFGLLPYEEGVLVPTPQFKGARLFIGTANPEFDDRETPVEIAYILSRSGVLEGSFSPRRARPNIICMLLRQEKIARMIF